MQDFQIPAAHGKVTVAGFRKLSASFEVNLPSVEWSQTRESGKGSFGKTKAATRFAISGAANTATGKSKAPSTITSATEARSCL